MGFLSRFRRSTKTIGDMESISSDEIETTPYQDNHVTVDGEPHQIEVDEVESEWESTETIDLIHNDNDKKSKRLGERGKASQQTRKSCLLYTSPSPRDKRQSRMPSSA